MDITAVSDATPAVVADAGDAVLHVEHLSKVFRSGLRGKAVQAIRDVSFTLEAGKTLGYLGPNGSGKTTSIKCILGLIAPTGGQVTLFGRSQRDASARARVGYLPEHPYFYDYLKPGEVLDYAARLCGLGRAARRERIPALLEKVGLADAIDRPLRGFSKGMLQRVGIAQSLVNDPELLVWDEPMSGLDPIGRKEVRDLLFELRRQGRTIFVSSHILSDLEQLCDSVVILRRGAAVAQGALRDLLRRDLLESEVLVGVPGDAAIEALAAVESVVVGEARDGTVRLVLASGQVGALTLRAAEMGAHLIELHPRRDSLEQLFMRKALHLGDGGGAGPGEAAPATAAVEPGTEEVHR